MLLSQLMCTNVPGEINIVSSPPALGKLRRMIDRSGVRAGSREWSLKSPPLRASILDAYDPSDRAVFELRSTNG